MFISSLFVLLCTLLPILFAQELHAKTFNPPFTMAIPKPVDTYVARECFPTYCAYLFVFAGWFRDGEGTEGLTYSLKIRAEGAEIVIPVAAVYRKSYPPFSHFLKCKTMIAAPIFAKLVSMELTLINNFDETVFHTTSQLLLLRETDFPLPALSAHYELFIASSSNEEHVDELDFIEIGTSDFATILQQVHSNSSQHKKRYRGFSIEAIAQYQLSLPNPPNVLKINAAIVPQDVANSTAAEVFFMPPSIIAMLGEDLKWMRGCSQIDDLHIELMEKMATLNASLHYLQKQPVRALTMNYLLSQLVFTHFSGLTLLKIDVEGLDTFLVKDLIDLYEYTLNAAVDDQRWPCVVSFELNYLNTADRHTTEATIRRLREVGGYSIMSDIMGDQALLAKWQSNGPGYSLAMSSSSVDVFAYRCQCPRERLDSAAELMLPEQYDIAFLSFACNHK